MFLFQAFESFRKIRRLRQRPQLHFWPATSCLKPQVICTTQYAPLQDQDTEFLPPVTWFMYFRTSDYVQTV